MDDASRASTEQCTPLHRLKRLGAERVGDGTCLAIPSSMKRTVSCAGVLLVLASGPVSAQSAVSAEPWFEAGTVMTTLEIGGVAFSDFARSRARPVSGTVPLGDFTRRISARTAASVGGWVGWWFRRGVGVRAGASYAPSSFTVWNDENAQRALDEMGNDAPPPEYASMRVLMANASMMFRFPHSFGRVVPYGIIGGGVVRYAASDTAAMPPEARRRFAGGEWVTGALMFGVGATIPLQRRNLLMSFELTNHMARTPLADGAAAQVFEMSGIPVEIGSAGSDAGEEDVSMTNHVRLAIGLTLPLR